MQAKQKAQGCRFLSTPSGWRATRFYPRHFHRQLDFYPRPPGGGRPPLTLRIRTRFNFYPRPPGGGRHWDAGRLQQGKNHFYPRPPGGGRLIITNVAGNRRAISIHALRVEGDRKARSARKALKVFLSTPSGWRATADSGHQCGTVRFLSTPSGWRATRTWYSRFCRRRIFLSTPSGWRATAKTDKVFVCFCAKGRRICLFKTRKEKNLPVAF